MGLDYVLSLPLLPPLIVVPSRVFRCRRPLLVGSSLFMSGGAADSCDFWGVHEGWELRLCPTILQGSSISFSFQTRRHFSIKDVSLSCCHGQLVRSTTRVFTDVCLHLLSPRVAYGAFHLHDVKQAGTPLWVNDLLYSDGAEKWASR